MMNVVAHLSPAPPERRPAPIPDGFAALVGAKIPEPDALLELEIQTQMDFTRSLQANDTAAMEKQLAELRTAGRLGEYQSLADQWDRATHIYPWRSFISGSSLAKQQAGTRHWIGEREVPGGERLRDHLAGLGLSLYQRPGHDGASLRINPSHANPDGPLPAVALIKPNHDKKDGIPFADIYSNEEVHLTPGWCVLAILASLPTEDDSEAIKADAIESMAGLNLDPNKNLRAIELQNRLWNSIPGLRDTRVLALVALRIEGYEATSEEPAAEPAVAEVTPVPAPAPVRILEQKRRHLPVPANA